MSITLVAYFSATGTTSKLAANLAKTIGADLYEIKPEVPYTIEDLNWQDSNSRSTIEMNDPASRPALAGEVKNVDKYDRIFVGFPIWWGVAPRVVNSFLEQYDLEGKTIIPFATSGGSDMGGTNAVLASSCQGADLREGRRFPVDVNTEELAAWANQV